MNWSTSLWITIPEREWRAFLPIHRGKIWGRLFVSRYRCSYCAYGMHKALLVLWFLELSNCEHEEVIATSSDCQNQRNSNVNEDDDDDFLSEDIEMDDIDIEWSSMTHYEIICANVTCMRKMYYRTADIRHSALLMIYHLFTKLAYEIGVIWTNFDWPF